jgi:hypothetical protein
MIEQLVELLRGFWHVLGEMSPYLLFGFAVAGVLSVFLSARWVQRHLGGRGFFQVLKASAFGVPLPLCSCGVIPVSASLRGQGAGRGAVTSFLISTPQTGVDSILVTYSLLGPVYAIFRPLLALVSGVVGGLAAGKIGGREEAPEQTSGASGESCEDGACESDAPASRSARGVSRWIEPLRYGFVALPRDIAPTLLLGLVISAAITALVPDDFFAGTLGTGFSGMAVMLALAVPVYVCATASVPIAAALVLKGASPGAALVFLMTGPATNAATLATIWKVMGPRTVGAYLGSMLVCAFAGGFLLDAILPAGQVRQAAMGDAMLPSWLRLASAVVLLGVLGYAVLMPWIRKTWIDRRTAGLPARAATQLDVSGMTCGHCAQSVHDSLMDLEGVESASVDVKKGKAVVAGRNLDPARLCRAIEAAGFQAHPSA